MEPVKLVDQLKDVGYCKLKLPDQKLIEDVLEGFERFINEPLEYRMQWTFLMDPNDDEVGFLSRNKPVNKMTGLAYDFKDVFHFQPDLPDRIKERGVDVRSYEEWLRHLARLYGHLTKTGEKLLREIRRLYPEPRAVEPSDCMFRGGHVLRLIRYHMREREGGVIGLGHYDESLLTLNVAETIPGLRVGTPQEPRFVPKKPDECLAYPGRKAEQISNGEIPALWHDIVDARPEKEGDTQRISAVFFLDDEA